MSPTLKEISADIKRTKKQAARSIRWNLAVSPDTDKSLRLFLADQGGGRKGDLSHFVEEAVRTHLFQLTVKQAKAANARLPEEKLAAMIDEAVQWARNTHPH